MKILNIFGSVGDRTMNILKVAVPIVVFVKPLIDGQVVPGVHWEAASSVIDWTVKVLAGAGTLTFADKFRTERIKDVLNSE